jgi:hypothetical protein
MRGLRAGFPGQQAGGTEDAWSHGLRPESRYVLTGTAQLLREDSVPGGGEWIVAPPPGRRKDSAPPDWMVSDPAGHQSASLSPQIPESQSG